MHLNLRGAKKEGQRFGAGMMRFYFSAGKVLDFAIGFRVEVNTPNLPPPGNNIPLDAPDELSLVYIFVNFKLTKWFQKIKLADVTWNWLARRSLCDWIAQFRG